MENTFEAYLIGRLAGMEEAVRAPVTPQPETVPAPQPEPTPAERNQHFLANLEQIAGIKATSEAPKAEEPPATLSRQAPNFQRQFVKLAEAIASGQTAIVD